MAMKIGDVVHVKKSGGRHWTGTIIAIHDRYDKFLYQSSIATVNATNGAGHAVFTESQLTQMDGEWWER